MTTSERSATSRGEPRLRRAFRDERVDAGTAAVPDGEREAGLAQVLRHRPAHDAEPDEADAFVRSHDGASIEESTGGTNVGLTKQLRELVDRQARFADQRSERSSIEFAVVWHGEIDWMTGLVQRDVAASLTPNLKTIPFERGDCLPPRDSGKPGH